MHLLGQFLEVAFVNADTGESWQQLQKLGFEPAATGDIWPYAYGVVACEGLAIGLHARGDEALSIVFVRPEVAVLHRELTARGIDIEQARLGNDVFNELTLREPGGVALRVQEARSFSPPATIPIRTSLGRFRHLSLPCSTADTVREYWQLLGFASLATDTPWKGFALQGAPLAYHEHRDFAGPLLIFEAPAADIGDTLGSAGFEIRPRLGTLSGTHHFVARSMGQTFLWLDQAQM